jgi:hypothetical protein
METLTAIVPYLGVSIIVAILFYKIGKIKLKKTINKMTVRELLWHKRNKLNHL